MDDAVYAGGVQSSPVVAHVLDDEPGRRTWTTNWRSFSRRRLNG